MVNCEINSAKMKDVLDIFIAAPINYTLRDSSRS